MNIGQMNMLGKQIMIGQMAQCRLMATNILMTNIQMNQILGNDEAESGINPNSEDLDAEEDDGSAIN